MNTLLKRIITLSILFFTLLGPVGASLSPVHNTESRGTEVFSSLQININTADAAVNFDTELGCNNITDFAPCIKSGIIWAFSIIWFDLTQILAGLTAVVLDFILMHSISSSTYTSGIIEAGWEILRDFTNIIFIFALLVFAFKMVLGQGADKKQFVKIILIALVMNFSLFVTYAIVDASNILARVFYNRIETTGDSSASGGGQASDAFNDVFSSYEGMKSPSVAVLSTFNPQRIITGAAGGEGQSTGLKFLPLFFIVFAAGALNILIITIFISVMLLFLGRTIGIMILGILAPVAFASVAIGGKWVNQRYIGFNWWVGEITKLAFMAPVFLFFLYLTVTFATNKGVLASMTSAPPQANFLSTILNVVLPFAIVATLLYLTKKVTKKMAGDIGGTITEMTQKVVGGTLKAGALVATAGASITATGAAAALGGATRAVGAGASRAGLGRLGSGLSNAGRSLQTRNFNFAQTRLGQAVSKRTKTNLGAGMGDISYARTDTAVRAGANRLRARINDVRAGKTPQSVQDWQDNVDKSRDELEDKRIANDQKNAAEKATGDVIVAVQSDGTPVIDPNADNLQEALKKREAAMGRRTSAQAKAEKKRIEARVKIEEDEIKILQDDIKRLNKKNDPASKLEVATKRKKVEKLNKRVNVIKETSLEGQITQIKKQIENSKTDARAKLLTDDRSNRGNAWATQDSTLTIGRERRQARTDTQAARVGRGESKSEGKVGGNSNA